METKIFISENSPIDNITGMIFCADASELGFRPGFAPRRIETSIGNKMPFRFIRIERNSEGEALYAYYKQEFGELSLKVYND